MKFAFFARIGLILFLFGSLSSCVSKKKYREEISSLKSNYDLQIADLKKNLTAANHQVNELTLRLAERTGANNALVAMQDKLEGRIKQLENQIEQMNSKALSQQELMNVELEQKMAELSEKERLLNELRSFLDEQNVAMQALADQLKGALILFDAQNYSVEFNNGKVSVALSEQLVFHPGSTSRIPPEGINALRKISEVLANNPNLTIDVIGHTDNRRPPRNSITDNWQYSSMRAASVVDLLTKEFGLNSSQIMAAGKAEFSPATSNETAEGRALNRRIELRIKVSDDFLLRTLRRRLN